MAATKKNSPKWQTLGWYKPRRCWSKYRDGKRFYLEGDGSGTKTRASHELAVLQMAALSQPKPSPTSPEVAERLELELRNNYGIEPQTVGEAFKPSGRCRTIKTAADQFIAMQKERAAAGETSEATAEGYAWRLKRFVEFAGNQSLTDPLESLIERFSIDSSRSKQSYATDMKRTAKQFIVWCWENRLIDELPRNINKKLKGKQNEPNPNPMTVDEVKRFLGVACDNPQLYCYALLGINAGLYAADIATLTDDNFRGGYLRYSRAKTKEFGCVKLWAQTVKAIQAARLSDTGPVFRTLAGKPLNASSIRQMFNRACMKAKIPNALFKVDGERNKTFSSFRDTSATLINAWSKQGEFVNNVRPQFLAHKDSSLAAFYTGDIKLVDPKQVKPTELDTAVAMLRETYFN